MDMVKKITNMDVYFNNALLEMYDKDYVTMGEHSDQAQDLDLDSYICLFSCYNNIETKDIRSLKIKNKTDTIQVECLLDEKKLVAEERWKKKNKGIETYYYYYNDQQKLTDIVRFNARMKKFLPDYLYEYDTNGRISQLTQVSMSSASYIKPLLQCKDLCPIHF